MMVLERQGEGKKLGKLRQCQRGRGGPGVGV